MSAGLDTTRLENVHTVGGKVIARCPACAEAGEDKSGEHLAIWADGKYGCAMHKGDAEHRKRIFALVGIVEPKTNSRPQTASARQKKTHSDPDSAAKAALWSLNQEQKKVFKEVKRWPYQNAEGKLYAYMIRFEPEGDPENKTFRPIHETAGGWQTGDPPGKWLPYVLPEILKSTGPVFICEGEKTSDAGRSIGLICTTSAHGAESPGNTDWQPLAGRELVILPDHDAAGETYADNIFKIATNLNPAATVKIVRLPGLSDKGDLHDFVEAHDAQEPGAIRAEIESLANEAPEWTPEAEDPGSTPTIITRSLTDYADAAIDDTKTLLGKRYVCREGGMLFVGPSGIGKSSASVQQDVLWSIGKPAFGIYPARPMKITCVQAENDDGDLTEMTRGIMGGLQLTPAEREQVRTNTFYISEKVKTGLAFIRFIESVLQLTRPDLLRLDPFQSYLGGDTSDVEVISTFVHTGLNPLLKTYGCACVINHHTPKTTNRDSSKWRNFDWQYAGAGSAVLTNWARAILVVDPCDGNPRLFRFIAAKRGYRLGWQTETGDPSIVRYFKHAQEDGVIFWTDAQPDEIATGSKAQHSKDDILGLVPPDVPISRDTLLNKAQNAGIGINKTRRFINELVDAGSIHIWRTPRPRTNPRIDYARIPQPEPRLKV